MRGNHCSIRASQLGRLCGDRLALLTCAQGTDLYSPDNLVYLIAQADGNLVL